MQLVKTLSATPSSLPNLKCWWVISTSFCQVCSQAAVSRQGVLSSQPTVGCASTQPPAVNTLGATTVTTKPTKACSCGPNLYCDLTLCQTFPKSYSSRKTWKTGQNVISQSCHWEQWRTSPVEHGRAGRRLSDTGIPWGYSTTAPQRQVPCSDAPRGTEHPQHAAPKTDLHLPRSQFFLSSL